MFAYDDPEQGRRVLNMAVPIAAEGVTVLDDWDTLGHARHRQQQHRRSRTCSCPTSGCWPTARYGVIDPPLQVIFSIAFPIISGVYLGVAEAAYEAAVDAAATKANDPIVQRQIGLMRHRLQVASWALDGALDEVGDDPTPVRSSGSPRSWRPSARSRSPASRSATSPWRSAAGPPTSRARSIERCYRDIRAAKFHPLSPELTLVHGGRLALGLPVDDVL